MALLAGFSCWLLAIAAEKVWQPMVEVFVLQLPP
jgi:hypothetical protein